MSHMPSEIVQPADRLVPSTDWNVMDYGAAARSETFANSPRPLLCLRTPGAQDAGAENHPEEGA